MKNTQRRFPVAHSEFRSRATASLTSTLGYNLADRVQNLRVQVASLASEAAALDIALEAGDRDASRDLYDAANALGRVDDDLSKAHTRLIRRAGGETRRNRDRHPST